MNVPTLSQHTAPWGVQRLGTGVFNDAGVLVNATIGGYGCAITCVTMANIAFNPGEERLVGNVDDIFTNQGGYVGYDRAKRFVRSPTLGANMLDWAQIQRLLPNCAHVATGYYASAPADLNRIRNHIDAGGLVILEVRWGGKPALMHFVLAVAYNGNDIIVNDPEKGDRTAFSSKRFGTGNSATDIVNAHFMSDAIPNVAPAAPAPVPAPASPTGGMGSGPVAPTNNGDKPMTDEQEQLAYQIVLGRAREGAATGRTGYQFIVDAQAELKAKGDAQSELAKKLAEAVDVAEKQGRTITSLTTELNDIKPEYERTEVEGAAQYLTAHDVIAVDFSDRKDPVEIEAGMIVDQYSKFTVAGREYVRSHTSHDNGDWFGFPIESLTPYQPAAPVSALDLTASKAALSTSQSIHAMAADGLNGWQKFWDSINFLGGKNK